MQTYDRAKFFASVRADLFNGTLSQDQVNGMNAILAAWEGQVEYTDPRWLAYMLATTYHETAKTMQPIEEYGKGKGMAYGKPDPKTGQTYYGRGYVQLTWRENYARADKELDLTGANSLEWHASNALKPDIASKVMFLGMTEGWFRKGHTLARYFGETADAFNAREIINGDKNKVPSWSGGVKMGNIIANYYTRFFEALAEAVNITPVEPPTETLPEPVDPVVVSVMAPKGVAVTVIVNGLRVN